MEGLSSSNAGEYVLHLPTGGGNDDLLSMLSGKNNISPPQDQTTSAVNPFDVKSAASQITGQPFAGMNHDTIV